MYDEHFYGRNIPLDALPTGVRLYYGKPPYQPGWAGGLDTSFDGLLLLGFHAKAGTPQALLPHTYELDIADLRVEGASLGEIGLETMIAGELGVPLLLCVGDDRGCAEARALAPEALCVETKKSFAETGALVYPLSETAERIEAAARTLRAGPPRVAPYPTPPNPLLEIDLAPGPYRDAFGQRFPQVLRRGTVSIRQPTLCAGWAEYWRMKLETEVPAGRG
jgi:D-amino peptidase